MMRHPSKLTIERDGRDPLAIRFCQDFICGAGPRYLFGCNAWARDIATHIPIEGFIDDFIQEKMIDGIPIIRSSEGVPDGSLIVSCVVGVRPLSAMRHAATLAKNCLDYFAFREYSDLHLRDIPFLGETRQDYDINMHKYEKVFQLLSDEQSRTTLSKLLSFAVTQDISHLEGFIDTQDRQYFEPFLNLQEYGETFLDVGCYDGYTTEEFIKHCPGFRSVHVFEPEPRNMTAVKQRLSKYNNIHYHPYGASNEAATLRFRSGGSSSSICEDGDLEINVHRIDELVQEKFTFLKMDIEGGESAALEGARQSIHAHHPRLAIAAYHKAGDLWRIPELVLSIREDYNIFLRHYTEGITETVMFFVPR